MPTMIPPPESSKSPPTSISPEVPLASPRPEAPLLTSTKVHLLSKLLKITLYSVIVILSCMLLNKLLLIYTFKPSPHNREATHINTLAAGVKNVYVGSPTFNKLSNSVLILAKAAPDKMVMGRATLQNGYGGPVKVEATSLPINGESVSNNAYKITYTEVPSKDCERLTTGVGNNFVQLTVNDQILKPYPSQDKVSEEAASRACSEEKNSIVFYGN